MFCPQARSPCYSGVLGPRSREPGGVRDRRGNSADVGPGEPRSIPVLVRIFLPRQLFWQIREGFLANPADSCTFTEWKFRRVAKTKSYFGQSAGATDAGERFVQAHKNAVHGVAIGRSEPSSITN